MNNLYKTYIQKGTDAKKDIYATWGMMLGTGKLITVPKLKAPFKHTWSDEQGDDEYLTQQPCYEAETISIEFVYIGSKDSFNTQLRSFWNYLQAGEFSLFDVYYKAGIRCRYDSYDETYKWRRDSDIFKFTMKFKINNPLCQGFYVPGSTFTGIANIPCTARYSNGETKIVDAGGSLTYSMGGSDNFVIIIPEMIGDILR